MLEDKTQPLTMDVECVDVKVKKPSKPLFTIFVILASVFVVAPLVLIGLVILLSMSSSRDWFLFDSELWALGLIAVLMVPFFLLFRHLLREYQE